MKNFIKIKYHVLLLQMDTDPYYNYKIFEKFCKLLHHHPIRTSHNYHHYTALSTGLAQTIKKAYHHNRTLHTQMLKNNSCRKLEAFLQNKEIDNLSVYEKKISKHFVHNHIYLQNFYHLEQQLARLNQQINRTPLQTTKQVWEKALVHEYLLTGNRKLIAPLHTVLEQHTNNTSANVSSQEYKLRKLIQQTLANIDVIETSISSISTLCKEHIYDNFYFPILIEEETTYTSQQHYELFVRCAQKASSASPFSFPSKVPHDLQTCYLHGIDFKKADDLFHLALSYKDGYLNTDVTPYKRTFDSLEYDHQQARYYFERAAKQGHTKAKKHIADEYMNGFGGYKDTTQAIYWYTRAAEMNDIESIEHLITLLQDTQVTLATHWKNKLITLDPEYDKKARNTLLANLDIGEIAFSYSLVQHHDQDNTLGLQCLKQSYSLGSFRKAEQHFRSFYRKHKAMGQNNMAVVMMTNGKYANLRSIGDTLKKSHHANCVEATNNFGVWNAEGFSGSTRPYCSKTFFDEAIQKKNIHAICNLGVLYHNGIDVEQNYLKAKEYFEQAAEHNNPEAIRNLGLMYLKGSGIDYNIDHALMWFQKGVEQQDIESIYILGTLYHHGIGVQADLEQAKKFYEQAQVKDHIKSMLQLALLYENSPQQDGNLQKAKYLYQKIVEDQWEITDLQGPEKKLVNKIYSETFFRLASLYEQTKTNINDIGEIRNCYAALFSIDDQHIEAKLNYYNMLLKYRTYLLPYFDKIVESCETFATSGHEKIMHFLGNLYTDKEYSNMDSDQAALWYTRAIRFGHVESMYSLATLYTHDNWAKNNHEQAKLWYEKAAHHGHIESMYALGNLYHKEEENKNEFTHTFEWYHKAAEQGHAKAMFKLGTLYANKPYSTKVSLSWYKKSLDKGYTKALYPLAVHEDNYQNPQTALLFYEQAAEYGDRRAMKRLAEIYEGSRLHKRDVHKAIMWHEHMANLGEISSMLKLGWLYITQYESSNNENLNSKKELQWCKEAMKKDEHITFDEAMELYEQAMEKNKNINYKKALYWYQQALENGNKQAMKDIETLYEYKLLDEKDFQKFIYRFKE